MTYDEESSAVHVEGAEASRRLQERKGKGRGGDMARLVECLLHMHRALGSIPAPEREKEKRGGKNGWRREKEGEKLRTRISKTSLISKGLQPTFHRKS